MYKQTANKITSSIIYSNDCLLKLLHYEFTLLEFSLGDCFNKEVYYEQVPFGKVVRCPTCLIAVAVAQPQHGIQVYMLPTTFFMIIWHLFCFGNIYILLVYLFRP